MSSVVDTNTDDDLCTRHSIWQVNCRLLYDLFLSFYSPVGCLTAQWSPRVDESNCSYAIEALFGSVAENAEEDRVFLTNIVIPKLKFHFLQGEEKIEKELESPAVGKFSTKAKYVHDGNVNRLRLMPQCSDIFATQTTSGEVHLFHTPTLPRYPNVFDIAQPSRRLLGQKDQGYSLSWNQYKPGHLLSSSHDGNIYLWHIFKKRTTNNVLEPYAVFSGHSGKVEEASWSRKIPFLFGSVGADRRLCLWDSRNDNRNKPAISAEAHQAHINHVDFNKFNPYLLATGSEDNTTLVWDLRNLSSSLKILKSSNEILQVRWSEHHELILCSGDNKGEICVWNIGSSKASNLDDEHSELMFKHCGHRGSIYDIDWHPSIPFLILSVSEDQNVHAWKMGLEYYKDLLPTCSLLSYVTF